MNALFLSKSTIVVFLVFVINFSVVESLSISNFKRFVIKSSCHTVLGLGLLANPLLSLAAKLDPPVVVENSLDESQGNQVTVFIK